ncbi:uncharacterized protein LOC124354470 [Homalodisca vitripennis]|uniref:uncharacterized protein LOC124354470 n=1 Tax=Homalodisca vitripennis TaxID=197043 RepID=UPI001EECDA78|nr:uncharacterized protein LOC124354470 [Homalodisca vitripennis]KAG8275911.1 hypothetical protein J6590_075966 [Homalodisca vitripennis]
MGVSGLSVFNISSFVCLVSLVALERGCALELNKNDEPSSTVQLRVKRQEPDMEQNDEPEDYVADYAGNENNDAPKNTFTDDTDTFGGTQNNDNGINEDRFGDTFDNQPAPEREANTDSLESEERKPKKKKEKKQHPYLKKTFAFFKRVLDPDKLMQNAFIMEMMRRFSDKEEPEYEEKESSEEEVTVHTPKPTKRRRGRPRKKDKIPPGITGIIKKGMMTLSQIELDKRKLRRRVKMIKRMARKAKKPLKTAVKIFLSSRNQGGYGGGGYGNTNY